MCVYFHNYKIICIYICKHSDVVNQLCLNILSPWFGQVYIKIIVEAFFWRHNNTASREGKGRITTAMMFRKMLFKYEILSRVLSKIVEYSVV